MPRSWGVVLAPRGAYPDRVRGRRDQDCRERGKPRQNGVSESRERAMMSDTETARRMGTKKGDPREHGRAWVRRAGAWEWGLVRGLDPHEHRGPWHSRRGRRGHLPVESS